MSRPDDAAPGTGTGGGAVDPGSAPAAGTGGGAVDPGSDPAAGTGGGAVDPGSDPAAPVSSPDRVVRPRSWLEVRWRQLRNPPRPIVRAVGSSLAVAVVLGLAYVAYDVAIARGSRPPGGDLRTLAVALYIGIVVLAGTVVTYLVVPQPTGGGESRRRSGWSAALGFLAAVPIAYLVLVVLTQLVEPFLV